MIAQHVFGNNYLGAKRESTECTVDVLFCLS
jgi:hypothetical protein